MWVRVRVRVRVRARVRTRVTAMVMVMPCIHVWLGFRIASRGIASGLGPDLQLD